MQHYKILIYFKIVLIIFRVFFTQNSPSQNIYFFTHTFYKSHTGICISLGVGVYYAKSTAQKINTTSSCQAEMVALAKGLQQSLGSLTK